MVNYTQDYIGGIEYLNGNGVVNVTNVASTNEVLQENHYYPFGLNMDGKWMNDAAALDNKYQYNGKELNDDFALNLNDYGARWYDAAVGRFSAIDRFVDSIPPLSPYNYAGNNPIRNIDVNGDSIIVLSAPDNVHGLGHAAVLIGSENGGWSLYSKNGTYKSSGARGPSDVNPEVGRPFESLKEFANSESNLNGDGSQKYKEGYLIESDFKTDEKMSAAAENTVLSDYNVLRNSCIDVCTDALEAGGFNGGTENKMSGSGLSTYKSMSPIPNTRYEVIREYNKGQDVDPNQLKPKN